MSRSGYSDDLDTWDLIRWRGAVASAIRGKRGQALLREIAAALDAMPIKELAAESLVTADGDYCTLGAVGAARGMDLTLIDPEDADQVARSFGVAEALVKEIVYLNDEHVDEDRWVDVEICGPMRPHWPEFGNHRRTVRVPNEQAAEQRWRFMRSWVAQHLKEEARHAG